MKKLLLHSLLFFATVLANAQNPIITKWNTNINNDSSQEINIYTDGTYNYAYVKVDNPAVTGSGNGNGGTTTITFPQIGEYIVKITPSGTFKFYFGSSALDDNRKIIELSQWGDVSWNTDLNRMFFNCINLQITATDIPDFSNVTNMSYMFNGCTALTSVPNMNSWNTSNVANMGSMFQGATNFNENIGTWNVSNVNNMASMLNDATSFNQSLGKWSLKAGVSLVNTLFRCYGMSCENYSKTLYGWAENATTPNGRSLGAAGVKYGTAAQQYRTKLAVKGWTIVDGGLDSSCDVIVEPISTKWNTNANTDDSKVIVIPTIGSYTYRYQKTNDASINGSGNGSSGNTTITFPSVGEYYVYIKPTGNFKFDFGSGSMSIANNKKLTELGKWEDINWNTDLSKMFSNCSNLKITAIDIPNFSNVTDMSYMFNGCTALTTVPNMNSWNTANVTNMNSMFREAHNFNQNIGSWNTSKVTDVSYMFANAKQFNQNIGSWVTAEVTTTQAMFYVAENFNQNIGNWNTNNITDMYAMFYRAANFNQYIGNWNTSKVTNMGYMFLYASSFNQNVSSWNTSNVTNMYAMFGGAAVFNQNIGNWNTSLVTSMRSIFDGATNFNQNLGSWTLNNNVDLTYMFNNSRLSCENYSKTLYGWAENANTPNARNLGAMGLKYGISTQLYRNKLVNDKGWTIVGDSFDASCEGVLPVTLTSFTAKADGNYATLQWTTSNGENNKGFEIYRKVESKENTVFVKIGAVSATIKDQPLTINHYNFIDKSPLNGTNYYKLVQVDNDGVESELGIRSLIFSLSNLNLIAYPSPTSNEVTISFEKGKYNTLTITDVGGKVLQQMGIKPTENSKRVLLGKYMVGIYLIRLSGENGNETLKVLRK